MNHASTVLSIDFGTSNSLAGAFHRGKRIEALPLDPEAQDPSLMRTLLYFPNAENCFYGVEAIKRYLENEMEGRLFRSFKSHLPNRSYLGTFIEDRVVTLENMIGIFLLEIRRRAERILETKIKSAVIGRPARYAMDDSSDKFALHRMQKAAEFAGFESVEFVPEPLAAALDLRRQLKSEKLVLVGDFGGGTSDFTLIRLKPSEFKKEDVLGLEGCPLAGDALDSLFMRQRLNTFFGAQARYTVSLGRNLLKMPQSISDRLNQPAHIVHLKEPSTYEFIKDVQKGAVTPADKESVARLFTLIEDQQIFSFFEAIERCKRQLSDQTKASFHFDYPSLEITTDFERDQFVEWAEPVRAKIFAAMDSCLQQAQIQDEQVDLVFLTGGSAQVPLLRAEFVRRFGENKLQTQSHFHSVLSGLTERASMVEPTDGGSKINKA